MMLHLFETNRIQKNKRMKKYRCTVCEWIYDPAVGDPDGGIAAGTAFEDIPEDWPFVRCRQRPVRAGRGVSPPLSEKDERSKPVGLLRSSFYDASEVGRPLRY